MLRLTASLLSVILLLLSVFPVITQGAEQWAEPIVTKPWTESTEPAESPPSEQTVTPPPPEVVVNITETSVFQDYRDLLGTWYIWTPGAVKTNYNAEGEYVGHQLGSGALQGKIVTNEDGTYSMVHGAWSPDNAVTGEWRLSYPREINGEVIQALILKAGVTNSDWAIAPASNGKIRLLWAMYWADGSATWVYDSELYRQDAD